MERRQIRKSLSRPVTLQDTSTGETRGTIVDVTTEGVMLHSIKQLKPNYVFNCNVVLPSEMKMNQFTIGLDCLWSRPDQNPGEYVSGLQIIDASNEAIDGLKEMIRLLATN